MRCERVIAAIMAHIEDKTAHIRFGQAELWGDILVSGAQDLVIVADAQVGVDRPEIAAHARATAKLATRESRLIANQTGRIQKAVNIVPEEIRNGVEVVRARRFK